MPRYHAIMCGRYSLDTPLPRIVEHFGLDHSSELFARYNIAPSQVVPAVRTTDGGRELIMLRWGLLPPWAKDEKIAYNMINARAETVATKPAFRSAFRQRRCLIPASGFYEWEPEGRSKQPHYFRMRDGDVFAFAGLWEHWEGESGNVIESCTIIVTEANALLRPIHDRMPVILEPDDYASWLDPHRHDTDSLAPLLKSYPAARMVAYPVSKRVSKAGYDAPECVMPVEIPQRPRTHQNKVHQHRVQRGTLRSVLSQ